MYTYCTYVVERSKNAGKCVHVVERTERKIKNQFCLRSDVSDRESREHHHHHYHRPHLIMIDKFVCDEDSVSNDRCILRV